MFTVLALGVHDPLLIVHRSTYAPAGPVNVDVALAASPKAPAAGPDTFDHAPVPMAGTVAANVVVVPQRLCAMPAFDADGVAKN